MGLSIHHVRAQQQQAAERTSLDGHGIFAIIVFAVVSLVCIVPLSIPLPFWLSEPVRRAWGKAKGDSNSHQAPPRRAHLTLDHVWTPAIGILFLLATKTIGGEQVKLGIVGSDGVEPYDVLILFISLAYIAISLDATGLLRYLAFQVCLKAGTRGMALFLLLYTFFFFAGVLVGNDPVILSGTAFLVYFTRVAGINHPDAWIWAEFVAANISSAVLVSSNPTNLVIATGFHIDFLSYTAYMVLPSVASALAALVTILLWFRNGEAPLEEIGSDDEDEAGVEATLRSSSQAQQGAGDAQQEAKRRRGSKRPEGESGDGTAKAPSDAASLKRTMRRRAPVTYIPSELVKPDVDPRSALVDPVGAIFGSVVMAATLGTLVGTSVTGHVKVYMIALPGAAVCILRDAAADVLTWRKGRMERAKAASASVPTSGGTNGTSNGDSIELRSVGGEERTPAVEAQPLPTGPAPKPPQTPLARLLSSLDAPRRVLPTTTLILARLPFALLPFAFGMFILVQALAYVGFINIMAKGLGRVCASGGSVGTAFFIGFLAVVLCNVGGTNIGGTILLTRALQSTAFRSALPASSAPLILKTGVFSIAFGSNVGALGGTFAASLAGLLWRSALRQGGIHVTPGSFATWCAVAIVPATAAGIAVLVAEVRYFDVGPPIA